MVALRMGDIFIHPFNFQLGEYRATLVRVWCVSFSLSTPLAFQHKCTPKVENHRQCSIFKFMYLVVGPTVLWVQAVVIAGPAVQVQLHLARWEAIMKISPSPTATTLTYFHIYRFWQWSVTCFTDRNLFHKSTGYTGSSVDVGGYRRWYYYTYSPSVETWCL